jgi:starvation-inducible DNA-binding protein
MSWRRRHGRAIHSQSVDFAPRSPGEAGAELAYHSANIFLFRQKRGNIMAADLGIKEKDRLKIVEGLSKLLADSYTLYLKTHNFHWNVTGPMFQTLHLMFQAQYTELWNSIDLIAERIRSLDAPAPGTYAQFSKLASIQETVGVPKAQDMIKILLEGHEAVTRTARKAFPAAEKGGDQPTMDLLTQRMEVHEKTAWMLRSLLEK